MDIVDVEILHEKDIINDDLKLQMILLVREHPLLWDPENEQYKNRKERTKVWTEIAQLLSTESKFDIKGFLYYKKHAIK